MATAVLAYAQTANVKARLTIPASDTASDLIINTFCGQVNGQIEQITGRVLGPYPTFSTTLNGLVAAGATTVTLTAVSGLNVGDELMLGPVSGTHESQTVLSVSGFVVTLTGALVNGYASGVTAKRVYMFDGWDALEDMHLLPLPRGMVSVTSVEVATYTGGPYVTVPSGTDWFLRPVPANSEPGWAFTELWITNIPTAANTVPFFPPGYRTVRIDGQPGLTFAIPDEITQIAERAAVNMFRARASGGSGGAVQVGEAGIQTIQVRFEASDGRPLHDYARKDIDLV